MELGLVDGAVPRLIGGQAEGCSPVATAFETGEPVRPVRPNTVARSLAIGSPADGDLAVATARATNGAVHAVAEDAVGECMALLAGTSGVFGETAAGVTLGALRAAVAAGEVGADDRVVLLVTGDGLKTPGAVAFTYQPIEIEADVDAVLQRLQAAAAYRSYPYKSGFTFCSITEVTALKPAPDWELVYKRNPVERIKRDRSPLGILDDLPALIAAGYERVDEEDIVRLKWWGLYHDKPKIGTFMLRIKLPGGRVSPEGLRAIGEISNEFGRGDGELSTRQNVQLHWLELGSLPAVFERLHAAGLTSAGGCGDTVRNITGCPVAGLDADELFDTQPIVDEAAEFFYGNPDYSNLPRKHKITVAACAHHCNAPEINCIALVGAVHEGDEGFGIRVGGGLSSAPRIARDLGVFVPKEETVEVLRALLDAWKEDTRYRDLAREGADEVHGRRLRAGGDTRRGRAAARAAAGRLRGADARHARRPHRRPRPEAAGPLLHRRSRPSRPGLRRADDRARRPDRAPRRRRPPDAAAELRGHERPGGRGGLDPGRASPRSASRWR